MFSSDNLSTFVRTPEGHPFCGMFFKPFNKLAGRVLSGLKQLSLSSSFYFSFTKLVGGSKQSKDPIQCAPQILGSLCFTLCKQCVGFLTSHRAMNIEGLWDGNYGLWSLSEKS